MRIACFARFLSEVTTNEQISVIIAMIDWNLVIMVVSNEEHFKYPATSRNDSIRTLTLAQSDDDNGIRLICLVPDCAASPSILRYPTYGAKLLLMILYWWSMASHTK